jgi:Uma2 family endonuclease
MAHLLAKRGPSPTVRHQTILKRILVALVGFAETRRLGIVQCAPLDVIFSDENVVQPDVVFVSNARRSIWTPAGIQGGPDLCVEILSQRTEELDRGAKRLLYARYGVQEYWIVDPERNTVDVYRLQENPSAPFRTLSKSDDLTTTLLPGLSINLDDLFMP